MKLEDVRYLKPTITKSRKITWVGTALASCVGMSLTLEKTLNCLIMDPERTLTKKTFQIVKYKTLMHVLLFLSLRETFPSIVENSIMVGGTAYRNNIRITLGR